MVAHARPGLVEADGRLWAVHTQAQTAAELVADAGLALAEHDEIWMDGARVPHETLLSPVMRSDRAARPDGTARFDLGRRWVGRDTTPVRLTVRRSVPLTVDDGSVPYTIFTTAETVGEALQQAQLTLYLGDRVQPALGSRVSVGLRVHIERSTPVLVTADGRTTHTRTRGKTVGNALMDLGILVTGRDRVTPALDQTVESEQTIRVVRVMQVTLVEREAIPFESISVPDDNLEIDTRQSRGGGAERRVSASLAGGPRGWGRSHAGLVG